VNNYLGVSLKQEDIIKMFDKIAPKYDLVNRILSFGVDKRWRERAVREAFEVIDKPDIKVLDVACGTGDMIEVWQKEAKKRNINLQICGLDASEGMLEVAKKRFLDVKFYTALATKIPCESESLDGVSIAFGIRNVLEVQKAIEEFRRVLVRGGVVLVLEFTKSKNPSILRKGVDFYSHKILPKIAAFFSNKDAYEYLPASIDNFYTKEELASLFEKSGFEVKKLSSFNFSQVTLLIAKKI
jgi:demethylmenaquinone methyltransferase/2-methoxy-6-polyprenyl-1,4-benzoquinol methylase